MKERPILFSAPMVRALLAGTKTVTRRLLKPRHDFHVEDGVPYFESYVYAEPESPRVPCPYGNPGDQLWVKETHQIIPMRDGDICVYRATCDDDSFTYADSDGCIQLIKVEQWKPSIFMPRVASRMSLEVISVRVERLHDITEDQAKAEGVERDTEPCDHTRRSCEEIGCMGPTYRSRFAELWMAINGPESWEANPFVWVVEFKSRPVPRRGEGEKP